MSLSPAAWHEWHAWKVQRAQMLNSVSVPGPEYFIYDDGIFLSMHSRTIHQNYHLI